MVSPDKCWLLPTSVLTHFQAFSVIYCKEHSGYSHENCVVRMAILKVEELGLSSQKPVRSPVAGGR